MCKHDRKEEKRGKFSGVANKNTKDYRKEGKKKESMVSDAARQKEVESHCHTYTKSYQPSQYISSFTVQRNGF